MTLKYLGPLSSNFISSDRLVRKQQNLTFIIIVPNYYRSTDTWTILQHLIET